jgi:hypothetical protein
MKTRPLSWVSARTEAANSGRLTLLNDFLSHS